MKRPGPRTVESTSSTSGNKPIENTMSHVPFRVRAAAVALALLALGTAPARAALFDDEEARRRIEATNQRVTLVQKQIDERMAALEAQLKSQGLVELFNQIELLKADVARMRGQFEVITHELDEAQKRQRDLYIDLDGRLRKIEGGANPQPAAADAVPAPGAAPGAPVQPGLAAPGAVPAVAVPPAAVGAKPATPAPDTAADQRAYDAALDIFKAGNYAGAVNAFTAFVKAYPKSPLAASGQYWIGNAYFAQRDFRSAIAAQRQLIAAYPTSPKIPDALLNIATSQFEMGDAPAAKRTLNDIVAKYPQSDAAAKAKARLAGR